MAADRFAIDAMKAEIDGGAVEGRVSVSNKQASSRVEAELKGERLDLDAAAAFARSLAGPQGEWPEEAKLSLDIGRATSAGQELRPFVVKVGYGAKTIALERLKIGEAGGVMLEGTGDFDRVNATGKLALDSSAASAQHGRSPRLIAPFAPSLASRLNALGTDTGPVRGKLTLDLDNNAEHADRRPARVPADSISMRRSSSGHRHHHGNAGHRKRCAASISTHWRRARSASSRNCRRIRAAVCWSCSGSIA